MVGCLVSWFGALRSGVGCLEIFLKILVLGSWGSNSEALGKRCKKKKVKEEVEERKE